MDSKYMLAVAFGAFVMSCSSVFASDSIERNFDSRRQERTTVEQKVVQNAPDEPNQHEVFEECHFEVCEECAATEAHHADYSGEESCSHAG